MPSICPRASSRHASASPARYTQNLRLEDPALRTRTTPASGMLLYGLHLPAVVRDEHRDGAAGDARADAVGPARQDNRDFCAQHEAGALGVGQKDQLLRENVAGFEIRRQQDIRIA